MEQMVILHIWNDLGVYKILKSTLFSYKSPLAGPQIKTSLDPKTEAELNTKNTNTA